MLHAERSSALPHFPERGFRQKLVKLQHWRGFRAENASISAPNIEFCRSILLPFTPIHVCETDCASRENASHKSSTAFALLITSRTPAA